MKRKILTIILLSLLCQNLFSQFYWQKTYNSYIGGDDEGYDGCAADGSNFYVVGYTGILNYYMYVAKFNQLGDTLWTRTFIGRVANAVAPSDDGGCVITGQRNNCFSVKLDLNGNIIWNKTYPTGSETRDVTKTGDSGYVMCGGLFSGYVCKLDTSGNLLWEKYYDDSPQDFDKIEPVYDGYIICGRKFNSGMMKAFLMKIDNIGNIIWQSFYDYKYSSSFVVLNSGFLILSGYSDSYMARIVLIKTNTLGVQLTSDTINIGTLSDHCSKIIKQNENKLILPFYSRVTDNYGYVGKILKIDTNFNVIKDVTLNYDSTSVLLYNLIEAPGSNVKDIICFGSFEPIGFEDVDLYVARLDSALTPPPPISVNLISSQVPQKSELSQNYPNPFNPTTKIKFDISGSSAAQTFLSVYDITGKEISLLVNADLNPGSYEVSFDASGLSSGVYFYKISAGRFTDVKKMVLLK